MSTAGLGKVLTLTICRLFRFQAHVNYTRWSPESYGMLIIEHAKGQTRKVPPIT